MDDGSLILGVLILLMCLFVPLDLVLVESAVCYRGQRCSSPGARGHRGLRRGDPAQHHKPPGHSNLLQLQLSDIHPEN